MLSYDEAVLAWAKDYLRATYRLSDRADLVVEATVDWENGSDGFCETCYYEWNDSVLRYRLEDSDEWFTERLYMEFGDVTRALFAFGQEDK